MNKVAVLITCHNRKEKTLACLSSFYACETPSNYRFEIFMVDDGSTDNTSLEVANKFPNVTIVTGSGNLFWAGGMRLAWDTASAKGGYAAFLLLNDDVLLKKDCLCKLVETHTYAVNNVVPGIYIGATASAASGMVSYGGYQIVKNNFLIKSKLAIPEKEPVACDYANANILFVSKYAIDKLGKLDTRYTHSLADYDYTRRAVEKNIPLLLAPGILGSCEDDHGNNWKAGTVSLKKRIEYLKSPKGLAYSEYLYYTKKHFPLTVPYYFTMIWLKTLFPFLWEVFKRSKG